MNIGVFLGHPAHFHLLKNVANNLKKNGHNVFFVIKKKDILAQLLDDAGYQYTSIREGRTTSKFGLVKSVLTMEWGMFRFIWKNKIDILIGSTLSAATRLFTKAKVIVTGEDDAAVVPAYAKLVYPFTNEILTPTTCDNGKWNSKSIKYLGYQELAYLHPNNFTPLRNVVEKYNIDTTRPYFILRFASLTAHHDGGINGINNEIATKLVGILKPQGTIYITSERPLSVELEPYRIRINPLDMHHVMAFASLYIGDSQTMAAEAGVLGVPFIRFNDFVGRIGYLRELEETYLLGKGIKASSEGAVDHLYAATRELAGLSAAERNKIYSERREKMLSEKIDYAKFLTWFIENYPESKKIMKENPDYQFNFK